MKSEAQTRKTPVDEFRSLLGILEALPNRLSDDRPLREVMPGAWPTMGDLRRLISEIDKRKD